MDCNKKLEVLENSAVQFHISMLQGIINRMANNSANCKTWTVTLVTAMLVLLLEKKIKLPNPWISLIPVVLLYLLDCYYLCLERITISVQNTFLGSLSKESEEYIDLLYKVGGLGLRRTRLRGMIKALISLSTLPFYILVAMIVFYLSWSVQE